MDEQLLKDFIAAAQKDSYNWESVFAKFPELKSYDQQLLKDYVATAEQENYNYEVINPKFPEFGFKPVTQDSKKNFEPNSTASPLEDSSLASSSSGKAKPIEVFQGFTPEQKKQMDEDATSQSYMGMTASADQLKTPEKKTYAENLGTSIVAGVNDVDKMIASIPEAVYDIFAIPQNALAYATGLDISVNSEKTKAALGIENPILNYYKEEGKKLDQDIKTFNEANYKSSSIYENITQGNYGDAFELLGSGIARSAPVSVAMMAGGATLTPMQLSAAGTTAFYEQNADQLREDNPDASDIENNIKALTMSAAETVFSAIGEGQIGAVYRDIIKKEGVEAGTQIFKVGLADMYKDAIKKCGIPVGVLGEGIEEAATQVTQNMVSGKPAFEGAADAFTMGGGSGAVFTAPITLKNAKDRIVNEVAKADDRKQINTILGGSDAKLHTLYDAPKDAPINEQQLSVASLSKSRDLLEKNLKQSVKSGEITQDQAKQSLYVFDKTQQIAGQLRNVDIDGPTKVAVANLLKEREALSDKIQGQDAALSVLEKERIDQINEEIKKTIIESKNKSAKESLYEIPKEIASLKDDEQITVTVKTLEEVPEQYRDRAEKKEGMKVQVGNKILGLPIGKKKETIVGEGYAYTLTGKEAKDYAAASRPTKPKTLDEIQDEDVKVFLNSEKDYYEQDLKLDEELYNKANERFDKKNRLDRFFGSKPSYEKYTQSSKSTIEKIKNNPEQYIKDQIERLDKRKAEKGEEFEEQGYLDYLKEMQSKLKQDVAPAQMYSQNISSGDPIDLVSLFGLDANDPSNLQQIYDYLDKADKDLTKRLLGGANESGLAIPLGILQVIIKGVKLLTKGGMTLQEAIAKLAAENNVSVDDVVKGMKSLAETVSPETVEGYDKMMEDVNTKILDGLNRRAKNETILNNVIKVTENSDAYKNATDQQREQIIRDVKTAFGEKLKEAPSAQTITGQQKDKKITITETQGLKEQIKNFARGFKEGRASVLDSVKAIRDFVIKNKDVANLSRKDLLKVVDIMKTVKDEKSFDRATEKLFGIIDNANKDIVEVSKTAIDKEKLKAELKAAKDGAKGVANKIKAVKDYFDSVKEYGNLTRKDLLKVMKQIASVKDAESLDNAIEKINDIIDNAKTDKIEISELKMLKQTIKEVKLAKGNIKEKRKLIADSIAGIQKSGKLSAAKADALLKRLNSLNVESFEHLAKFIDYAEKTFADAEYQGKLSKANAAKASIKKLAKNKSNNYDGNLTKMAKRFLAIDPSLVEDIDQYNKIAADIIEGTKGSSAKAFKPTVEIKAADAYIEDAMEYQKERLTDMLREQVEELLGVDGSTLTYDEMTAMLETKKEDMSAQDEKIVRSAAIKLFDMYSTIIDSILSTGKDPMTGEDVDLKESKKEVVKNFMDMDLRKMDIKDAIRAVDALNNFIVNGSTAKMEDTFRKYEGDRLATKLEKMGIKAKRLKIYFSKRLGRFLSSQFATQPLLFEELFGGQKAAEIVEREMGVTDLKSNKSKAQSIVNKMVADYTSKFLKTKPNGQNFNTAFNGVERGMVAFVSRADAADDQKSFDDRKSLIEQSIDVLKAGNEEQQKKAQVYREVYDKVLKDAKNAQEARANADAINAEAVDFWIEKWAENYDDLADVAENIHNSVLGRDLSYTPDKFSSLGPDRGLKVEAEDDFDIMGSAFIQNSGNVYKKKTGRLMEATTESKLPSNRFVDLSFDSNNANLMLDALIDIKTAGDVRQVDAFMKSDAFQKIMPNAEERQLLQARIDLMVRNFRNKNHYNYDEIAKLSKSLNRMAALGASYALGGIGQPLKQVIPVAINTMANGGIPSFSIMFDNAKRDFIANSGEAIANRGTESVSEFKAIDSLLDKAAESTPEKAMQIVEKVSGMYLKIFLQKPDAYIAKASWLAYYEKSLKKQGEDIKNIDYSSDKLNKEAAQYATRMVDRQQNISDADLKGKVFSANDGLSHIMTKVILPFASFRINQWLRMNNDLGVVTGKTSMKEDRRSALKSLAGFGVEVAAFNAIGAGLSYLTYAIATSILRDATGSDKEEEDKKKVDEIDQKYADNLIKGRAGSLVQDVFSPIPLTDPLFEYAAYQALDATQSFLGIDEAERKNIFKPKWSQEGLKALGSLGIAAERTKNLYDVGHAWATGKITTEAFGKSTEKDVRQRDKEVLGPLTTLALLNSVGALPSEFNSSQKTIFKEITKQASTKDEQGLAKEKEKKEAAQEKSDQKLEDIDKAIKRSNDKDVKDALIKMKKHIEDGTKPTDAEKEDEDREDAKKILRKIRSNRDGSKRRSSGFGSKKFGAKPFGAK